VGEREGEREGVKGERERGQREERKKLAAFFKYIKKADWALKSLQDWIKK
jgi:hypothetical protein